MSKLLLLIATILIVIAGIAVPALVNVEEVQNAIIDGEKRLSLKSGGVHYEDSVSGNRTIVLIHGFSVPSYTWDRNFPTLVDAGFRVIRYDLYGRGHSDKPSGTYNRKLFVEQLYQLLKALEIEERVVLVGLSMGGGIAAAFASEYPEQVSELVVLAPFNTAVDIGPLAWPLIGEFLAYSFYIPGMAVDQLSDFVNPQQYPQWPEKFETQTRYVGFRKAILSTMREYLRSDPLVDFRTVGRSGLPSLVIWGDQDLTFPIGQSDNVLKSLEPNATFVQIDGAGHALHYENFDQINNAILDFLLKKNR